VVKVVQREARRSNAALMSALAIIGCVVCAFAALLLAFLAYGDLAMTGFPDSHFTDYDKAAHAPKQILMWVECGFGILFLVLIGFGARVRAVGLPLALIALVVVAIVERVGMPWYFIDHLRLDNGIGG
jgi:hypothetical protein